MPDPETDLVDVLARTAVFAGLPRQELSALAGQGRRRSIASGQVLMRQGEPSDCLHVIVSGRVRIEHRNPAMQGQVVMAGIGPCETVGEMGVVDHGPRSATVVAVEDTQTIEIDTGVVASLVARRPEVALALARLISLRLRGATELIERMARWGSEIAVARSRWEERFLTDERTALKVVEEAGRYLELADAEFGTPWRTTTYCDTEDFSFYRAAEASESSTFRLREYHAHRPKAVFGSPSAWLELKGTATCGDKYRVEVPVDDIPSLLHNADDGLSSLGLGTTVKEMVQAQMRPVLVTQCYRVAYASPGESLRITADYGLTYSGLRWSESAHPSLPVPISADLAHERGVVLELKWTDQLPEWAADLVRSLRAKGADNRPAKFVVGMRHLLGEEHPAAALGAVASSDPELASREQDARRLDEMKANFIGNASHELRAPLSSIRAFSELLVDDPDMDAGTRVEFAGVINYEAQRLSRLVDDILDLSRIEAGAVTWRMVPTDLVAELRRVVDSQQSAAHRKNLELLLDVDDNVGQVIADPDALQHIMLNLIGNAIEVTEVGRLLVSATRRDTTVEVSVSDTGPGFSEADQARIFERFYQPGSVLTEKPVGSGLGLAICQKILDQHDSLLRLVSELGVGSRFSFDLQAAQPVSERWPAASVPVEAR